MASVLLVDDEPESAEAVKMLFDLQGVQCWTAANSDEALRVIAENKPDLIILDIRLERSKLDGFGVLEEARKIHPDGKIFMVTGYDDDSYQERCQKLGAAGYLTKPLSPDTLVGLLKNLNSPKP